MKIDVANTQKLQCHSIFLSDHLGHSNTDY